MPLDPYGLMLPQGVWADQFREAGGVSVQDALTQRVAEEAQQQQAYADALAAAQAQQDVQAQEAQQQQYVQAADQFVDWPTYQRATQQEDVSPHQAYDDYIQYALPYHMQRMGYSPQEINLAQQEFMKQVQKPMPDYGFFGNLWESMKSGVRSGTTAEQAFGNVVTGDRDALAKLVTEQATGEPEVGPLQRANALINTPEAKGDPWESIKAYAQAAWEEPQGSFDWLVNVLSSSYPAIAGGLAGMVAGLPGAIVGTGAGSGTVEIGSQILERIANEAQKRGVDPRDAAAVYRMLQEPEVYDALRDAAVKKGVVVGVGDAALAGFTMGVGGVAARALRTGNKLRAGGAALAGGIGEPIGSSAFEAASQVAAGDDIDWSQVIGEAVPGVAEAGLHLGMGAVLSGRGGPTITPPPPGVDEEGGLAANTLREPSTDFGAQGPVSTPTQSPFRALPSPNQVAIIVDNIEQELKSIPTNPLFDTLDRVSPGWRENASSSLEEPAVLDINDPAAIRNFLTERGVATRADDVVRAIDLIAQAPDDSKQAAIADIIENISDSRLAVAEPLSRALVELARMAPKTLAQSIVDERTVAPSLPLLELIRRTTGQTSAAERSALTQAWVDHFLTLPQREAQRAIIADQAWEEVQKATRLEDMMQTYDRKPVDQAALDAASNRLDRVISQLPARTPTSRAKLIKMREDAQLLLEESVDAYNRNLGERPDAGGGEGRPVGGGSPNAGRFLTAGGRSSTASAITPLQYRYLNELGGRRDIGTSIGERNIADSLGVAPEEVIPIISEALAQGIALDLTPQGAERGITQAIRRPTRAQLGQKVFPGWQLRNEPFEGAAAREAAARRASLRQPVAPVSRRSLRPGELIPTADIVAGQRGPVEAAPNIETAQREPGGSLLARPNQEGPVAGLRRGTAAGRAGTAIEAGVGEQSNASESNTGVPRQVTGRAYPEGERRLGRPLTTQRTASADVRRIEQGLIEEEKKQRLKAQEQRKTEAKKAEARSLKQRERRRREALNILGQVADEARGLVAPEDRMDALHAAYEKLYPSRNYEADTDELLDAKPATQQRLSPSLVRQIQMSPFNSVMNYLGSVMNSPLQRAVAGLIEGADLKTTIRLVPGLRSTTTGERSRGRFEPASLPGQMPGGVIEINPETADNSTVLHEATHAATIAAYDNPQTEAERAAKARIDELYNYTIQQRPDVTAYGFKSPKEFIAEAFSNNEFQALLASIPLPNAPKISAWTAFKQFVMELLGAPSVLSEVLIHGEQLFGNRATYGSAPVDQTVQAPRRLPSTAYAGLNGNVRTHIAYQKADNKYTLYPVTPAEPAGVKGAGVPNLTRDQVEQRIAQAGSQVLKPVADSQPAGGTPKNTDKKLVGFGNDGNLKAIAFEQKDGTWTYYQSATDVRADPDAKVTKGISKDAAQRYISAGGFAPEPPAGGVRPQGTSPTSVGYKPAGAFRMNLQDVEGTIENMDIGMEKAGYSIDDRLGIVANLRQARAKAKLQQVLRQYVEPARKAGAAAANRFNMTQEQVETTLQKLHTVERMQSRIRAFQRGNMDPTTLNAKVQELEAKQRAAEAELARQRSVNPAYVQFVEQEVAPAFKKLADNTIDMMAEYGLITRDSAEQIKQAYDFYVPLQTGERTSIGKASTGKATSGDYSFARMVDQASRVISRGEMNRMRKAVADFAKQNGVFSLDDPTKQPPIREGPTQTIRWDPATNSLNEGWDSHVFDENAIDVYDQGVRTRYIVSDPSLLEALHPYRGETRKNVITGMAQVLGWLNHIIAIGKTSLNPLFPPFNAVRDIWTANVNMPAGVSRVRFNLEAANPLTWAKATETAIRDIFGAQATGMMKDAQLGMIGHRDYLGKVEDVANQVQTQFNPGVQARAKQASRKLFDILSVIAQISESAPRYAVYKAAKASGMSDAAAAYAAKTASVNFEKRGIHNPSNYWIFGNAKMQSLNAALTTMERKGVFSPTVIGATTGMVLLGALAATLGMKLSDKDRDGKSKYTKIPNYKKDSQLMIKEGAFGAPIPQELAPFYILGNALTEWVQGAVSGADTASRIATSILNQYWPGNVPQQELAGHKARQSEFLLRAVLPSQVMPLVDLGTGRNTFGTETVPGKEDKLKKGIPMSDMGNPTEQQLATNLRKNGLLSQGVKGFAEAAPTLAAQGIYNVTGGKIDVAPQQLRLLNQYYDPIAETTAFWRDMLGLRDEKYKGDVVNPLVRKFTGHATVFYDQEQFDDLLAKAVHAQYQAQKLGSGGIAALSPEDQALARSAKMLTQVQSDANNLFKGSQFLTKEQRQRLNDRKQELILDGIRRYNELRDRTVRAN